VKSAAMYTPEQHEREHLRFTCKREGERFTVRVLARINALNAQPIRDRVLLEIQDGAKWITIDLRDVEEIEKRYFGELLSIAQHAKSKGGAATILDAQPDVYDAFLLYGLARPFTFAISPDRQPWPVDPRAPKVTL
jgi:anti-anti-sigma regulatory factor